MHISLFFRVVFSVVLVAIGTQSALAHDYKYPIKNPLAATIIGTPVALQADLLEAPIKLQTIKVFPERKIPKVFHYDSALRYGFAKQKDKNAPLVYIIGGTGAEYNSRTTVKLANVFYTMGYHVVTIPSSTNPNFITTASSTSITGPQQADTADYYRLISLIDGKLSKSLAPRSTALAGYSLGGFQSAFVAKHADAHNGIKFNKVLVVNPPLSLFNSTAKLDAMLEQNIPGGMNNISKFLNELQSVVADYYVDSDRFLSSSKAFNEDAIYAAYRHRKPTDEKMAALIGMAFRVSGMNLAYVSDVMSDSAYVVPGNYTPSVSDSKSEYFKILARLKFIDYYNGIVAPYYSKQLNLSERQLLNSQNLKVLESYIRNNDRLYLMHNKDDIIMSAGEVDYLKSIFGNRARIYPSGGHLGNVDFKQNVSDIKGIFGNE